MQIERPKIELYKVRNFGNKFSATFDFIRENYKLWLRLCTYLLLPLCMIQGFVMEVLMGILMPFYSQMAIGTMGVDTSKMTLLRLLSSYIGYFICVVIGAILLVSICYGMMKYYQKSPDRLRKASFNDLKPLIVQAGKRALVMSVVLFISTLLITISLIMFSVSTGIALLAVLMCFALFVCFIPLAMVMPVYIFEYKQTVYGAILRGMRLGFKSFWPLFGLLFVMGFLANILSTVTTIPWYVLTMIRTAFTLTGEEQGTMVSSPIYSFGLYLFSVLMNFGMYITMSLSTFAVAYHYGSVAEENDGFSVEDDIQNFEQLAEKDTDIVNFDKL